jgi:hypothetical protein
MSASSTRWWRRLVAVAINTLATAGSGYIAQDSDQQ